MSILDPTKGVDLYAFSAEGFYAKGVKTAYHVISDPTHKDYPYNNDNYNKDHYEMHGGGGYGDRLTLEVYKGNNKVEEKTMQVSGATGVINKNEIESFILPSVIHDDYCFSFGLYYADTGVPSGLTNAHQVYGVITKNQSKWMEELFTDIGGDKYQKIKLSDLIIPGSHDSGMYVTQPNHYIAAFANTQKDPIENQLALGARIFDFRPGKFVSGWGNRLGGHSPLLDLLNKIDVSGSQLEGMFSSYLNEIRHMHSFIPGATYKSFLSKIVDFLRTNKKEIVIINAVSNGIIDAITLATKSELDDIASQACEQYPSLKRGDKSSLKKSVKELIDSNERLIIIGNDKILGSGNGVSSISTYSDAVYQSNNSNNVIGALKTLNSQSWSQKDVVKMSLQLTGTAPSGGIFRIVKGSYQASSPLFATKAATDRLTYPWISDGNIKSNNDGAMITLSNDYYDSGLTEVVAKVLRQRISAMRI